MAEATDTPFDEVDDVEIDLGAVDTDDADDLELNFGLDDGVSGVTDADVLANLGADELELDRDDGDRGRHLSQVWSTTA